MAGRRWRVRRESSTRKNRDGTKVRYLQLAHNRWDPVYGRPGAQRCCTRSGGPTSSTGPGIGRANRRTDPATRQGRRRADGRRGAGAGVRRVPPAGRDLAGPAVAPPAHRHQHEGSCSPGTPIPEVAERVLFALVANRALAPELEAGRRRRLGVALTCTVPGLADVSGDGCTGPSTGSCRSGRRWRATSTTASPSLFYNLEVDLLFFDTTSTHFQIEQADESGAPRRDRPADRGDPYRRASGVATRTWGKSKDHRDDLPQVVIGMAVTRDGIRCGCGPGRATPPTPP